MARVATIESTSPRTVSRPLTSPIPAPSAIAARTAIGHGTPWLSSEATSTPVIARTAPIERSNCPATRLTDRPMARTPATLVLLSTTLRLALVGKTSGRSTEKSARTATSATAPLTSMAWSRTKAPHGRPPRSSSTVTSCVAIAGLQDPGSGQGLALEDLDQAAIAQHERRVDEAGQLV